MTTQRIVQVDMSAGCWDGAGVSVGPRSVDGSLVIVATSDDVQRRAAQLIAGLPPQQQQAVMDAIQADGAQVWLDEVLGVPEPVVGEVPARVRGFRVRLDLIGVRPPVWRR